MLKQCDGLLTPIHRLESMCVMFVKDIHIYTHSHNSQRLAPSLFIAVIQEKLTRLRTTVNKNSPSLTGNQNLIYCLSLSACLNTLYEYLVKYTLSLGVYFYIRVCALLFVDVNTTRIH